jgi:hypothetical protein
MSGDQKVGEAGSIGVHATEYATEQFGLQHAWTCLVTQLLMPASISSSIWSIQAQRLNRIQSNTMLLFLAK